MSLSSDWSTTRCLRLLRPLKSKITALRDHLEENKHRSLACKSTMNDEDLSSLSVDKTLNIEDEILPAYTRSKQQYSKKRVRHSSEDSSADNCDNEEDYKLEEEISNISLLSNPFEVSVSVDFNISQNHQKLIDDISQYFKSIIFQHFQSVRMLKLTQICAVEVGIHVGLNEALNFKNLEEKNISLNDQMIHYWYESDRVNLFKKWVVLGHIFGYMLNNTDILHDLIKHVIVWLREKHLTVFSNTLFGVYLEQLDPSKFWSDYDTNLEFSKTDLRNFKFEAFIIQKGILANKISVETDMTSHFGIIQQLIEINHGSLYYECLEVLKVLIANCCHQLNIKSPLLLLETTNSLQIEHFMIINSLSLFIKILHLNNRHNGKFLEDLHHHCKTGYKSILRILRLIKLFIKRIPINHRKFTLTSEDRTILRKIFKPEYDYTIDFIKFITKPEKDILFVTPEYRPRKRFKSSFGDLI